MRGLKGVEEYLYSPQFLGDWVKATGLIVVVMVLTSALYPGISQTVVGQVIEEQIRRLVEAAGQERFDPASILGLIFLIVANNIQVSIIIALSSPTILIPLMIEAFQGAAVGYLVSAILHGDIESRAMGVEMDPVTLHYGLVPHGVIEIPAISMIAAPLLGVGRHGFRRAVYYSIGMLPYTILMLAVAGVVESTITIILIVIIITFKLLI